MLEITEDGPVTKALTSFAKNFFEIVRNILVVATLKYIQVKTGNLYLGYFVTICNVMLGGLVSSYFLNFSFKSSLFASNKRSQLFGIALSFIFIGPLALAFSWWIGYLVRIVSDAQIH